MDHTEPILMKRSTNAYLSIAQTKRAACLLSEVFLRVRLPKKTGIKKSGIEGSGSRAKGLAFIALSKDK